MSNLAGAFSINADQIRIRHFEYGGQQFKVRIPLSKEAEDMFKRVDNPPQQLIDKKFSELSKSLFDKKEEIAESGADIKFTDDGDVLVGGKSLKEMAKSQASGEIRILESIKLLVPTNGKTLDDITYDDVESEFPLPVQLSLVKKIAEVVSPNYDDIRKN